jgi:hypothetical protein
MAVTSPSGEWIIRRLRLRLIGLIAFRFLQVVLNLLDSQWRVRRPWLSFGLGFKRVTGRSPGVKSTDQRSYVGPSSIEQCPRHTGAGVLVVSRAIRDHQSIARNL